MSQTTLESMFNTNPMMCVCVLSRCSERC